MLTELVPRGAGMADPQKKDRPSMAGRAIMLTGSGRSVTQRRPALLWGLLSSSRGSLPIHNSRLSLGRGTDMATILRSSPYFPVRDVARSAAYYEEVFGFGAEYTGGDPSGPPQFAICSRDGFCIMLKSVPEPQLIRPSESQGGTWDAFFWVDDAAGLHAELAAKGATVVYGPLVQEAYSMLEFAVRDSDGHVLGFGQALPRG